MTSPAAICPILIERDRELALLNRVAAEVGRGTARLVVITGEGGAGKSRLITELVGSLDDTWTRTITSASSSRRPFADVISRAEVGPDTPHVEIGRALAAAMPTAPTVVVIDDAHLLDGVTLRALGVALDLLEDKPVLILAGFRSGATDATPALVELRRHPSVVELALRPLSADGIAEMAAALDRSLDDAELDEVMRRSGGNPFFAEELLRSPDTDVSWTVTEAVCEHVRGVGDAAMRVANVLAVAEVPVATNVMSDLEPGSGLQDLIRAEIVVDDHGHVVFRHALIGEALRRRLSAPDRRELLARLAERLALEPMPPAAQIAHHWLDAGDRSRAAHWAALAAEQAATERRYATASDLYEIALLDPPVDDVARAELLERATIASMWARLPSAISMVRANEADRLYRSAGVPWRAAAMWLNPTMKSLPKPEIDASTLESDSIAAILAASGEASRGGEHGEAANLARDALGRAIALGDVVWECEAALHLVWAGELVEGEAFVRRRLLTARLAGDVFAERRCEGALIEIAVASGDMDGGVDHHFRAMDLLAADDPSPWTYDVGLALLYVARGDLGLAREHVARAVATGDPVGMQFAQLPQSWIDLEDDRLDDARARIAEMATVVRVLGVATYTRAVLLVEARMHHRLGELDAVLPLLDEADSLGGEVFELGRPDQLLVRARVAADLGLRAMVADVAIALQTMIDHGAAHIVPAELDWVTGLWERVAGQTDEACRRIEAAAIGMEAASRWVLAAEAWIELAELAPEPTATKARERAATICDERHLTWVRRKLDALDVATKPAAASVPTVFAKLTPRQRDIATLVAQGRSNQEIADQLFLSVHTVRNQLVAIFDVLGVSRRAEIAAMAARGDGG